MKREQFRPCDGCGEALVRGVPVFYRVRVETMGLDANAVRRAQGLELMMGNPALAQVLGPDEDLASPIVEKTILICVECAIDGPVLALLEKAPEPDESDA